MPDGYHVNSDGQKVFRCTITWTPPGDKRYAGGSLWLIMDGTHYQLGGLDFSRFEWETTYWPTTQKNVTFYVLSVDTLNRRNTYVAGVTPKLDWTWNPPTLGSAGQEYTSVITGLSVGATYGNAADGTYRALVTCTFTPPSDPTWGGVEVRTSEDSGATWKTRASGQKSPVVFEMTPGITAATFKVGAFSVDVNGRINTYQSGVTPTADIIVGNAAGQFDCTKFKATTYDPNIFTYTAGKFTVWAMDGSLIVTGSISSAALDATQINVGGGGNKPGKFAVYNAAGTQIGFIGVESGYEGAWFKTLGIGGSSKAAPKITADSSGNVSITGGTFELDLNGTKTEIKNAAGLGGYYVGLGITNNSTNYRFNQLFHAAEYYDGGTPAKLLARFGAYLGYGSLELRDSSGTVRVQMDGYSADTAGLFINNQQVVCKRQSAVATQTIQPPSSGSNTADSVTGNLYNAIENNRLKINDILAALRAHGLIAP